MCLKFLSLRVEWVKILPAKPETALTLFLSAAQWALSLSLFSSILISLNYVVRRKFFASVSIIFVMALSFAINFGIATALDRLNAMSVNTSQTTGVQLGGKGLILSNSPNRNLTEVVLLEGTTNPLGPRVVAAPNQPLVFYRSQTAASAVSPVRVNSEQTEFTLPPVPFGDDTPWFLQSLDIDIRLNAEMFQKKFNGGFFSYLFYSGAFIFLLCALGYVCKFSAWPLANLFIATLVFRGVLSLSTFFNTPEMQEIIDSFFKQKLTVSFALPLCFFIFGALIHLYSLLAFAARRKDTNDV